MDHMVYCCKSPTGKEPLKSVQQVKGYRLKVDKKVLVFRTSGMRMDMIKERKKSEVFSSFQEDFWHENTSGFKLNEAINSLKTFSMMEEHFKRI